MASVRAARALWFASLCVLGLLTLDSHAAAQAPTEHQVKAVFVYNFSLFVEWPRDAFAAPGEPLVIGVLGNDAFAAQLEDAVRGERSEEHPLVVRRFMRVDEIDDCQILFIDRSEGARLDQVLAAVRQRNTLTVSDLDGAARRGVMMQFATDNNRVRLLINVDSARTAGLTISSKLLRPAEIVRTDTK